MNHCILVDVSEWKPECISYLIIYAHIARWALANKHHEIKKNEALSERRHAMWQHFVSLFARAIFFTPDEYRSILLHV